MATGSPVDRESASAPKHRQSPFHRLDPARFGATVNDDLPCGTDPCGTPEISTFLQRDTVTGPKAYPGAMRQSQQHGHAVGRRGGVHLRMEVEAKGEAPRSISFRSYGGDDVLSFHVVSPG